MQGFGLTTQTGGTVRVTISAKAARLLFNGCQPAFIQKICKGRCCWVMGRDHKPTTSVFVEPGQRKAIQKRGGGFNDEGILVTLDNGKCRFQNEKGMCSLHAEGLTLKPRSCCISPWILTKYNRLIIRNRYKLLLCYKAQPYVPAYRAFAMGLETLFGRKTSLQVQRHFDNGGGDYTLQLNTDCANLVKHVMAKWHQLKNARLRPDGNKTG